MASKTLTLAQPATAWPRMNINSVARNLDWAWALGHVLQGQVDGEVQEGQRCEFVWMASVLEQVAALVREADELMDGGPAALALSVHSARALCEVMMSDASCVPGRQHLSDEIVSGWLGALAAELTRARGLVVAEVSHG